MSSPDPKESVVQELEVRSYSPFLSGPSSRCGCLEASPWMNS